MHALIASLLLAATSGPLKLASNGFSPLNVDERTATFFDEYFSQQLQQAGVPVTTRSAVQALIGLERQRELLGCSAESSSCLAELAGALGVDGIIVGNVAKFGDEYTMTVKLISAKDARTLFTESARVEGERRILDWLSATAARMARVAGSTTAPAAVERPVPAAAATASQPVAGESRSRAWVTTGVAGGLLLGTITSFALARGTLSDLRDPSTNYNGYSEVEDARRRGELFQGASGVLGVATLAAAGYATWLFITPGRPAVSFAADRDGAAVVLSGSFQ